MKLEKRPKKERKNLKSKFLKDYIDRQIFIEERNLIRKKNRYTDIFRY